MTKQPRHLLSAGHLLLAGTLAVLALFLLVGTNYARHGIEHITRLVATDRIRDWARHITKTHPEVIRHFGQASVPDHVISELRREAETYGVKAFDIRPVRAPLGTRRVHARHTFSDPEHRFATVALTSSTSLEEERNSGLVKARVPLLDEQGRTIGQLVAVADTRNLHRQLSGVMRRLLFTGLLLLLVIPLISLLLLRRTQTDANWRIHHVRDHDELTGLPNQHACTEMLDELTGGATSGDTGALLNRRSDQRGKAARCTPFACIAFGINELGKITCSEGHEGAGYVLRTMAGRFARVAHEQRAHIFRIERDDFLVILPHADEEQALALAERLRQESRRPLYWRGKSLLVSLSIGITFCPRHATTSAEVKRQAALVRQASRQAKGKICIYNAKLDRQYSMTANIERLLHRAARNCERYFSLRFQPIVELRTETLQGFEALLRMHDDNGDAVSPAEFVPLAERLGLMDEIGAWVLMRVCAIAAMWPGHLQVSVNLSPAQFQSGRLVEHVTRALETSGLSPQRLNLEVTESLMLEDWETACKQLARFRQSGVKIVLDDFGTGYSSMSYLWKFRFDKLKIDRSFTRAASSSTEARNILRSLLIMAHSLKLPVIAEGVETIEQALLLRKLRCDYAQGWYYGKPMKAEELAATITRDWQQRHQSHPEADAADIAYQSAAL